jgi:hypothetical protein
MPLFCGCDDTPDEWYLPPGDYSSMPPRKRRTRCRSCRRLISSGDLVAKFECFRWATSEVEERIHGDIVALAPEFMCEECADLFFSLHELGFCIALGEDMRELVKEYAAEYGPRPMSMRGAGS